MISTLFTHPVFMSFKSVFWLLFPLCASVAIVYKTVRCKELRDLPKQIISLMIYIVLGVIAVSLVLWLIHTYWPVRGG